MTQFLTPSAPRGFHGCGPRRIVLRMRILLLAAALLLIAAAGPAVTAESAWSRATAPRQTVGAAYVQLRAAAADRLVGVSSPVAARAGLHEMRMDGAVMRMREVAGLALPPGRAVALAPGGYHIMLVDLRAPLTQGQTFPLHLVFEHAPAMDVTVTVRGPGG